MKTPERILIIRLKSIGDILHTLPAVHAVRKNYPDAHISYLVRTSNALLLEGFSAVDEIITFDRADAKKPLKTITSMTALIRRLRADEYDLIIDLQGYGETAWLSRLLGAPERWGSVYKENRRSAYTKGISRINKMHVIDWNLLLLKECGLDTEDPNNTFDLPENYLVKAREQFTANGLDPNRPTLMLQPFTSNPGKNWPLESYLAVAEHFKNQGIQVFFCGGPADREALSAAAGYPVIAGAPFLVVAGMIKLSKLVIGGDTGILHLAAALQVPVRMILRRNASKPGCSIPYGHLDWVIDPTDYGKIEDIPAERVIRECREVFS